jgi:hypothetical protein
MVARPDRRRFGKADHRWQIRERAVQVARGIADATPFGRHDFDEIADGRSVNRAEKGELAF